MAERVLSRHFENLHRRLLDYASAAGLSDHPDVRGLAREGFVQIFLQQNLPSLIDYRSGQIMDEFDNLSGQVDIILQSAISPRIHIFGNLQIAFADAVIGAIEVKSSLTTAKWEKDSHLKSALESCRKIKSLSRSHNLSFPTQKRVVELASTPYFLVAYHGPTRATLQEKMVEYGQVNGLDPDRYWPDVTLVMDHEYYLVRDNGWIQEPKGEVFCYYQGKECLVGLFVYVCHAIESWNATAHHTQFSRFFHPLDLKPGAR